MAGSVHILDRCKDFIKHVQYLVSAENPNPPQINKQQCELLAEKLPRLQGAILKFEVDTYRELLANEEIEGSEIASLMILAAELNSLTSFTSFSSNTYVWCVKKIKSRWCGYDDGDDHQITSKTSSRRRQTLTSQAVTWPLRGLHFRKGL